MPLPMPIAGDRRAFSETLIEDYSKHAWANLPVTFTLSVEDAAGQVTQTPATAMVLPARRFFDPLAAAVIEQRRDLLWARANAPRVAQILRAVSHRPEDLFRSQTAYLRLRFILRRLETATIQGLKAEQQEELAEALWDLAIQLEEGDLADALERLRRAQERLSEAMKDGASDQEIAELMQELRQATDNYLQQLSRQAQQNGEQGDQQQAQNSMQMTQDDLQRMMDRIQELMEQGRMAEAEQALQELQQMMENMRVTQGQGQGSQSAGQQAMEGLAETLREQQGLSDQAFRDLQEQFNPGAQAGESQGNQGRNGGQGRGQSHQGEGQGRGQADGDDGDGTQQGQESLADRQQALRDELGRQQGRMPGAGTPAGDAAREALDRAGRAMEGAEQSLRQDDYAGAIDQQSEAMEALREGMRALGEAMAQQQQTRPGQGSAEGDMQSAGPRPVGSRNEGSKRIARLATKICCRARMSIDGRASCWMKFAAARAKASAPKWNAIICNGCWNGSDRCRALPLRLPTRLALWHLFRHIAADCAVQPDPAAIDLGDIDVHHWRDLRQRISDPRRIGIDKNQRQRRDRNQTEPGHETAG